MVTLRVTAGFAMVIATGTTLRGPATSVAVTIGATAVTATATIFPGFTHAFKAFPQCSAFLLAHVVPSLPHGGTPGGSAFAIVRTSPVVPGVTGF